MIAGVTQQGESVEVVDRLALPVTVKGAEGAWPLPVSTTSGGAIVTVTPDSPVRCGSLSAEGPLLSGELPVFQVGRIYHSLYTRGQLRVADHSQSDVELTVYRSGLVFVTRDSVTTTCGVLSEKQLATVLGTIGRVKLAARLDFYDLSEYLSDNQVLYLYVNEDEAQRGRRIQIVAPGAIGPGIEGHPDGHALLAIAEAVEAITATAQEEAAEVVGYDGLFQVNQSPPAWVYAGRDVGEWPCDEGVLADTSGRVDEGSKQCIVKEVLPVLAEQSLAPQFPGTGVFLLGGVPRWVRLRDVSRLPLVCFDPHACQLFFQPERRCGIG